MITIVVGSATGMGAATVRRLHRLEHEIVGVDRAEPEDPDLYSGFFFVDLNDGNRVQDFVAEVKREGKPIGAIVYCAAIHYPAVPFEEYPLEKWDHPFNVNVRSAFIILHGLASQIVDGGRIVTIGSGGVHTGSVEVAYAASKSSLVGFTKGLARHLAPRRIQVNCVMPGAVNTKMAAQTPPDRLAALETNGLFGRWGEPDEIAVAVEWLLHPENTYTTGAMIDVNGGHPIR